MSILTKIAIVVLVVLVIGAAVIFINMAITTPNFAWLYQQEKLAKDAVALVARQNAIAMQQMQLVHAGQTGSSNAVITQLQQQNNDLQQRLKAQQEEIASLTARVREMSAAVADYAALLKSEQQVQQKLTDQLADARQRVDTLTNRNLEQEATITEMQGQLDRGNQYVRVLRETVADLEGRIIDMRQQLVDAGTRNGPTGGGTDVPPVAEHRIAGQVNTVRDDIASINVGSAQGVTKGMRFIIYRDGNLVGYLDIQEVGANTAAGYITQQQRAPMIGDRVTNRLAE